MSRPKVKQSQATKQPAGRVSRRHWLILATVLLCGLLLRVGYLVENTGKPDFKAPLSDAMFHHYWAKGLATGDWALSGKHADPQVNEVPYLRPPGYPFFLAAVYSVTGPSYLAARVAQLFIGLASCALGYLLARRLFGPAAGLVAAGLMAVFWMFIYYEGELQEPFLLVLLSLGFVLALHAWVVRPAWWRVAVAGLLVGAFALTRANILLLIPAFILWIGWVLWQRNRPRALPGAIAAFVIAVAAVIAPVTIRNLVVSGEFVLISSNGAINLYIGNNEQADGYTARVPILHELTGLQGWSWFSYQQIVEGVSQLTDRPPTHAATSNFFIDRALDYMSAHPGHCLALAARRALLFWGPVEVSNNKEVHFERHTSPILRWLPGFPVALAGGLLGLATLAIHRRKQPTAADQPEPTGQRETLVLIAIFVLGYFVSFLPFLVAERFRVPIVPFLLVLAAPAIVHVGRLLRTRMYRSAGTWTLTGLALFGLSEVRWVAYTPDRALWHMGRAEAYSQVDQIDAAVAEYRRSIELLPTFVKGRRALAMLLDEHDRDAEALEQYEAVRELTPLEADVHYEIGRLLAAEGRAEEAERAYRRALELDTQFSDAWVNLGALYAGQGRLDAAIDAYQRAIAVDPQHIDARYNLGNALARQNKVEAAANAYESVLELDASHAQARLNLGNMLAHQGELDAAMATYRRVIELNPSMPEPHYNLASLLARESRIDEAIAELEQALRINPRYQAARQALEHLRGEREQ